MPDLSSLTTAHRQILYLIHESRQAYYNRLKKKAHTENGMSNTTVITALKRLQEEDMIQIIEEDKIPARDVLNTVSRLFSASVLIYLLYGNIKKFVNKRKLKNVAER